MQDLTIALQVLVASSIFFVWVVRYDNIVEEFRQYGLPDWLRDLVGILKLTLAALLLVGIQRPALAAAAGSGIAFLMLCALGVHLRARTPLWKRLPSLALGLLGVYLATWKP
jgi:uncharacterized membrane protein YphA (DoxX/SURF4 family)